MVAGLHREGAKASTARGGSLCDCAPVVDASGTSTGGIDCCAARRISMVTENVAQHLTRTERTVE